MQKKDMKVTLSLLMILATISCNNTAKTNCITQQKLFDRLQTHYTIRNAEYGLAPIVLVSNELSYVNEDCLNEYNRNIITDFEESSYHTRAILIELESKSGSNVKLSIAHRNRGKIVFYHSSFNFDLEYLDSIYFHSIIYD